MKLRLLLSAIVATATALGAFGSAHSEPRDAQAQAAALLSRPHTSGPVKAHERPDAPSPSAAVDAQASAAALLSGRSSGQQVNAAARIAASTLAPTRLDAHEHAAALLRGSHITVDERSRTTHIREPLGKHPAELVAQTWSARGINPNTFIVAHPARLQLLAASPIESQPQSAANVPGVSAQITSERAARLLRTTLTN